MLTVLGELPLGRRHPAASSVWVGTTQSLTSPSNVLGQLDLDRVQAQFLERAFDSDVLGLDREAFAAQRLGDLIGVDRAVEMPFRIGVGLDRERALGELRGHVLKVQPASFFQLLEPLAMLFDHPQVILGRERRQALRDQIVASEPRPDLDQVAGLAEFGDGLGQDQIDVAVLGTAGMILAALDAGLPGRALPVRFSPVRASPVLGWLLAFGAAAAGLVLEPLFSIVLAMRVPILITEKEDTRSVIILERFRTGYRLPPTSIEPLREWTS